MITTNRKRNGFHLFQFGTDGVRPELRHSDFATLGSEKSCKWQKGWSTSIQNVSVDPP
jgi:hypothetical protein